MTVAVRVRALERARSVGTAEENVNTAVYSRIRSGTHEQYIHGVSGPR